MRIGVMSRGYRYVLPDLSGRSRVFNFTIGAQDAPPLILPHSAAATPGRYIMEMVRRAAGDGSVTIVNPLLDVSPPELQLILSAAVQQHPRVPTLVVEDRDGRPLAYRLPAGMSQHLSLLSGIDAATDAAFLGVLTNATVATTRLPVGFAFECGPEGFTLGDDDRDVYRWIACRATTELAAASDRDSVPFAAILPFHAGDILFLLLALRRAGAPFGALVVDRRYRDIAAAVAPHLACIEIDLVAGRSQAFDWDPALRDLILQDQLPKGYLYTYCRPSRRYDNFPIHLIDQYAFACGAPVVGPGFRETARVTMGSRTVRRRILLHVDGGWPMKIYPDRLLAELVAVLGEAGFAVTVVSGRNEERVHGQPNARLRNLEHLHELLDTHDLLIGMDSFPAHYAAYVVGFPTLCLFSSTQPANSDAPHSGRYRAMEAGLDCCPCRTVSKCPRFGGDACRNFVAPRDVAAAAVTMWTSIYGERP